MITNAGAAAIAAKANEIPAAIEHIIAGIEEGELETNKSELLGALDIVVCKLHNDAFDAYMDTEIDAMLERAYRY